LTDPEPYKEFAANVFKSFTFRFVVLSVSVTVLYAKQLVPRLNYAEDFAEDYAQANLKCKCSLEVFQSWLRLPNDRHFFVFGFVVIVTWWWSFDRYERVPKRKGSL